MQGIFQKENTDKALKYGIYRHLPTYEKIIRNLVSFYMKNTTEHTVQPVPGKFISTKTNGTLHGYGMKNIMDVVEKYRGIFQSQMVEDYFAVMISVYADIYSK